jgi:hypothetical protein
MSRKFNKSRFNYGTSQDFSRPFQDPEEVRLDNDWENIGNIRAPQTKQMGIEAIPQTVQMSIQTEHPRTLEVVPTVLSTGRIIATPRNPRPIEVSDSRRDNVSIININPAIGKTRTTSMPRLQFEQAEIQTQRRQTNQMGMQARPQTAQMGMQARPQTAQMGMQARPQTAQMSMNARPQTAQMGLQAQTQQKPVMVSMGTMMVQQPEQVKTQPSIMQSIGAMFGLNEEKEEEFIYYGYKTDPEPFKRELRKYGVTYLRKLAKENGLKRYSTADKKELVKMLAAFYSGRQEMNFNNRNCLGGKELQSDYTLQELRKAASKLKLKAYSKLSKNDLCQVLHYYDNVHSKATEEARKYLDNIYKKKNNL